MIKNITIPLFLIALMLSACATQPKPIDKVLIFSKTLGYKHESIPAGIVAIRNLGNSNNFEIDTTKNADLFTKQNLKQYKAVIFLSTTMNVLNASQEAAFKSYIQAGGGFVGIHAAADTEYDWPWYNQLVGAQFESHPEGTPEADFLIIDRDFIATKFFTDSIWRRQEEIYNYKNINPEVSVVMTVDESTYKGGTNGEYHPFAWYHEFDGGRAFYTGVGHTEASFAEPLVLQHILGGIYYALGRD